MIMTLGVGYYGCNEIAKEIEEPYGSDKNDLPLDFLQQDFVDSLRQVYMASCAPIPDTYDSLVQAGRDAHAAQAPPPTPELRTLEAELARHGVPMFPKTFTHDDVLAFPLTAWTTKVGDADLAQYLYLWVRSQK